MKQTNKKEFSKFLNKFEKLLDYHFELLDSKIELNLFDGNTDNFLKTSNCKFSLSTESGQIIFKILFFDKNKNEIFSKIIGNSGVFDILSSKGSYSDIAISSAIDLSDVGMQKYNFFKNETHGKDNYKLYKKFVRVAITKFDFLYNNLNSSNKQVNNSSNSYLNALNTLFDLLIHGTFKTQVEPDHLLLLVDVEERNRIFGESSYFFSGSSLSETFENVVRKIEVSTFKYNKFEKSDIISLLNILDLIDKNKNYDNFTKKLNLVCFFIKELKQTSKFKLEESKHRNIYSFVRDIVTNKANNLIVSSIDQERFRYNGKRYTSELKVSDLKSTFRLVAKK
jgi:hypothetical protein